MSDVSCFISVSAPAAGCRRRRASQTDHHAGPQRHHRSKCDVTHTLPSCWRHRTTQPNGHVLVIKSCCLSFRMQTWNRCTHNKANGSTKSRYIYSARVLKLHYSFNINYCQYWNDGGAAWCCCCWTGFDQYFRDLLDENLLSNFDPVKLFVVFHSIYSLALSIFLQPIFCATTTSRNSDVTSLCVTPPRSSCCGRVACLSIFSVCSALTLLS